MSSHQTKESQNRSDAWRSDLPASLVVFLVALPLCMGIAVASGAPVSAGLVSGIVGGIVVGALAGAPLQVSGPAAGLTVLAFQCIQEFGIEELGVVVLLAGAIQVAAGLARLGRWFRAVSPAVVHGMLAGIGILILSSQFHVMLDNQPRRGGIANLSSIPEAISNAFPRRDGGPDEALERHHRLKLLREAAAIHQRQSEITEQVHHLLAGNVSASPLAKSDDLDSVKQSVDRSASSDKIHRELKSLGPEQARLLDRLQAVTGLEQVDELRLALANCRNALDDLEQGNLLKTRSSQDAAVVAIAGLRDSSKSHGFAAAIGVATISIILTWQWLVARRIRCLPAPLVAIVAAIAIAAWFDLPVLYVEVPERLLGDVYWPSFEELRSILNPKLLFLAMQIALIASAETLLCATAVDQLHSGPRTRYDRELVAQGIGNMICGAVRALPLTGVIVRSSANVNAGAATRWSTILHGVWLLLFVAVFSWLIRLVPIASLAAILVYAGFKLIDLKVIKSLFMYGRSEVVIYIVTIAGVVVIDLLTGVLMGLGLSVLKLLHTFTRLQIRRLIEVDNRICRLHLQGSATFLRLPELAAALENVPAHAEVHVDCQRLSYIDHACLDLLIRWEKQHCAAGRRLILDWDSLAVRHHFQFKLKEHRPVAEHF